MQLCGTEAAERRDPTSRVRRAAVRRHPTSKVREAPDRQAALKEALGEQTN